MSAILKINMETNVFVKKELDNKKASIESISAGIESKMTETVDLAMKNKYKDLEVIKANAFSASSKITDFDVAKGETEITKLLMISNDDMAKNAQSNIVSQNIFQLF